MKITNKFNLPEPLVAAAYGDYDRGESDYTVTELIAPPQQVRLRRTFESELVEDVVDRIWSIFGSAMHRVLEHYDETGLAETRYYAFCSGQKVGGKVDRMVRTDKTLTDYKVTSAWSIVFGSNVDSWTAQQNVYRWLLHKNGIKIDNLKVVAILRDWSATKAKQDEKYPQRQVVDIDLEVWPLHETEQWVTACLDELMAEAPRPCTEEERWHQPDKWAVMKEGRKSALRVLDSQQACDRYLADNDLADTAGNLKKGISVDLRVGADRRCEDYCPVKRFCQQYQDNYLWN